METNKLYEAVFKEAEVEKSTDPIKGPFELRLYGAGTYEKDTLKAADKYTDNDEEFRKYRKENRLQAGRNYRKARFRPRQAAILAAADKGFEGAKK